MRNSDDPGSRPRVVVWDPRPGRDYGLETRLLAERGVDLIRSSGRTSDRTRDADIVFVHIRELPREVIAAMRRCVGIVV